MGDVLSLLEQGEPVVLIEGRRALPDGVAEQLEGVGAYLADRYPNVIFRSGNAEGSDTAFSLGVVSIDPSRMEYVLPSPNMGKKRRHPDSPFSSLSELPQEELERLCDLSVEVSPKSKPLTFAACGRIQSRPLAGRGRYLLRDTMKVLGSPALNLAPAVLGLFYVDLADPDAGGTGHTIRVCRQHNVPVVFQNEFLGWGASR
jgi:hypothetical protein